MRGEVFKTYRVSPHPLTYPLVSWSCRRTLVRLRSSTFPRPLRKYGLGTIQGIFFQLRTVYLEMITAGTPLHRAQTSTRPSDVWISLMAKLSNDWATKKRGPLVLPPLSGSVRAGLPTGRHYLRRHCGRVESSYVSDATGPHNRLWRR